MNIKLVRNALNGECTIGDLFVDGVRECYTLEDCVRAEKIAGKTAIQAGRYEVTITFSNRFQKKLPLLHGVPNFEGVRIHTGNTAENTEGCILVGKSREENKIVNSRAAFEPLYAKIEQALNANEKVFIEIT
jgi:hypothetical protein